MSFGGVVELDRCEGSLGDLLIAADDCVDRGRAEQMRQAPDHAAGAVVQVRNHHLSRNLQFATIKQRLRHVQRFIDHVNEDPWNWTSARSSMWRTRLCGATWRGSVTPSLGLVGAHSPRGRPGAPKRRCGRSSRRASPGTVLGHAGRLHINLEDDQVSVGGDAHTIVRRSVAL